jgi:hypothetical protein
MVLIPIPIGTKHTAIMEGSAPRLVRCEQCGIEYVYTAERTVQSETTNLLFANERGAEAVALQNAQQALIDQLRQACDPVPCPACGWYQAPMVQRMRQEHLYWMVQTGVALCALFPVGLAVTLVATLFASGSGSAPASIFVALLWLITLSMVVGGPLLLVMRSKRVQRHNPNNEDVEIRKQLGRRLAVSKDDYEKMIKELRKKHIL